MRPAAQRSSLFPKRMLREEYRCCHSLDTGCNGPPWCPAQGQRAQPAWARRHTSAVTALFKLFIGMPVASGARAALETAGQPGGPSEAAAQLALGVALSASAAPGLGSPPAAAAAAQREALAALQAAVALAPDDPSALYSLGLMQVISLQI